MVLIFAAQQTVGQTDDYCIRALISNVLQSPHSHYQQLPELRKTPGHTINIGEISTCQTGDSQSSKEDQTISHLAALHMLEKGSLFWVNNERFLS